MRNARLDESQAGIKSAGRNINNLRYADDTTLMAEGKEKLPGASTGDPTHDKVTRRRPDKQGFRTQGTPWAGPTRDKVMWKRPDEQGGSGLEGPPDLLEHLSQKPESVCLTILHLSPTLLTLTVGYPRSPFSGKS